MDRTFGLRGVCQRTRYILHEHNGPAAHFRDRQQCTIRWLRRVSSHLSGSHAPPHFVARELHPSDPDSPAIKSVRAAQHSELSVERLLPFMSQRRLKAGQVLINKGDKADLMYYLANGTMEIREIGKIVGPGAVHGEIGTFARDQKRMATVACVSDCKLYVLSERKAKELYFQDRSFGLAVLQLIIARLLENRHQNA